MQKRKEKEENSKRVEIEVLEGKEERSRGRDSGF